jgi:hypothetical protein
MSSKRIKPHVDLVFIALGIAQLKGPHHQWSPVCVDCLLPHICFRITSDQNFSPPRGLAPLLGAGWMTLWGAVSVGAAHRNQKDSCRASAPIHSSRSCSWLWQVPDTPICILCLFVVRVEFQQIVIPFVRLSGKFSFVFVIRFLTCLNVGLYLNVYRYFNPLSFLRSFGNSYSIRDLMSQV